MAYPEIAARHFRFALHGAAVALLLGDGTRRTNTLRLIFGSLLCLNAWAQDKPPAQPAAAIAADPATLGYAVNNRELRFKDHVVLPRKMSLRGGGMIDDRHRLANLIADEQGSYEQYEIKKIVVVDNRTGEVKPTPYAGLVQCFVDGNLATLVNRGRHENSTFSFGRYGEALKVWQGRIEPEGLYLNLMSCTLEPRSQLKVDLPPRNHRVIPLRPEHGQLLTLEGALPGDVRDASPEVQRLMQQPFMRNMALPAHSERWILRKPNGDVLPVPNNPGEAAIYGAVAYLPYMGAYFIEPRWRFMLPSGLQGVPQFARILYPDGRVVLYGVPDAIAQPAMRGEIAYAGLYTKAGLVWRIRHIRIDRAGKTNYKGELKEGFYLDRREAKTLVKIPDLSEDSQGGLLAPLGVPNDGCLAGTRREVVQRQPHILFDIHYINLCTGE